MKARTWEEAFGQIPVDVDPIKQKQREIQQSEWEKELPYINLNETLEDMTVEFLKEHGCFNKDLLVSVKEIVAENARLRNAIAQIKSIV